MRVRRFISVRALLRILQFKIHQTAANSGAHPAPYSRRHFPTLTPHSQAKSSSGCSLLLDPVDFLWNNPLLPDQPAFQGGQRGAIVELFGWPYKDIAMECDALGKMGYMAVKVFPPQESVFSDAWPQNNELNPWWFMYQPVSYRLHGRHGSRDDLRAMIRSCRSAGVRVYADAVINHMTGSGNDIQDHRNPQGSSCALWGAKNSTAGSPYFTAGYTFDYNPHTQQRPAQEFPSVPYMPTPIHRQRLQSHRCCRYGPSDFHCDRVLGDWSSGFSLNYGWLVGLSDLNTGKDSVRARIADYLTDLLGIGFSGFRIDAAKHVQPDDLAAILGMFKENFGGKVPDDWQTYLEVIIGGEKELLECEYQYAARSSPPMHVSLMHTPHRRSCGCNTSCQVTSPAAQVLRLRALLQRRNGQGWPCAG